MHAQTRLGNDAAVCVLPCSVCDTFRKRQNCRTKVLTFGSKILIITAVAMQRSTTAPNNCSMKLRARNQHLLLRHLSGSGAIKNDIAISFYDTMNNGDIYEGNVKRKTTALRALSGATPKYASKITLCSSSSFFAI
jgi:hypothetical protein